jgi:peptidoglycan/LPS O-acetylase OafA/YrhL
MVVFLLGPLETSLSLSSYFAHPMTSAYLANVLLFPLCYTLPGVFANNPYPNAVNGSLWSLPIEVFLYGILAVLGLFGLLRKKYPIAGFLLLLVCVETMYRSTILGWRRIFHTMPPINLLNLSIFFFLGCLYYLFSSKIKLSKMSAFIALVMLYISLNFPFGNIATYILLPYIVIQFAYMDLPTGTLFEKNDISYGLYIYAFPIQQTAVFLFYDVLSMPLYLLFPLAYVVLILCSSLSWKFVEQPFLTLKQWRPSKGAS